MLGYQGLIQVAIRVIGIITFVMFMQTMPNWFEGLRFLLEPRSVVVDAYEASALTHTTWYVVSWLASMLLSLLAIIAPKFVMSFLCLGVSKMKADDVSHDSDTHLRDVAYWQEVSIALMGLWFVSTSIPNLVALLVQIWSHDESTYGIYVIQPNVIFDAVYYAVLLPIGLFLLFGKNKILRAIKRTRY